MNKSESIGNLAKALAAVQSQLKPAVKDSANPFFKSKYADLNSVWDACRDLLADNNLSVAQLNDVSETGVIIETVLMHASGEWISGKIYLPLAKHDPQGVGSATTYGRRYGLAAIVGIVADEDDDGNAASSQPKQNNQPKKETKTESLGARIVNAVAAINALGVTPETQIKNESDADYFDRLSAQYKRLKDIKEGK